MKIVRAVAFLLLISSRVASQNIETVSSPNIKSVQLHMYGDQQSMPALTLNSGDRIFLSFDDLEGNVKSYYYTYVLCDYNWNPANLNPFDYMKGFTQNRITTYRYSSVALTRYTHYQAILPERNCLPSKSGNYLLKVFLDGDTSKVVFTKQMVVVDSKTLINAAVVQPFTPQLFNTHQKIRFSAAITGINSFSAAQQVKVVILQNYRWDNAQRDIPPTFVRGTTLEYNSENIAVFPGGKEWRWLDLRSLRLQSDRVDSGNYKKTSTALYLKPDRDRSSDRYVYFADLNGMFAITTYEAVNPLWQGDYATVTFKYRTPDGKPYSRDLFMTGQFTDYRANEQWKMKFNDTTGMYENTTFMKQGYYNYAYYLKDSDGNVQSLEGNYWETENHYTILVYYKSFTDRNDQLIGITQIDSRTDRPGISF